MDHAKDEKELSPAGSGDARTPDKTIGQIKYADDKDATKPAADKKPGGAGEPKTSKLEPEKRGGIGGP
jgi:hypothetical protein